MELIAEFDKVKALLVDQMIEFGVFLDKTRSTGGKGFRLKLHESRPDAPLSPFYLEQRRLRGSSNALKIAADTLASLIRVDDLYRRFDRLADIPVSISPIVGILAVQIGKPMVTPRPAKSHGTGATVEGPFEINETILLIDDDVTMGDSKLEAIVVLREQGLVVKDCVVIIDREQGGRERLAEVGVTLHAVFGIAEFLNILVSAKKLCPEMAAEIRDYLAAN
ncbi:MAG: hypothetical protein CEN92_194 [Candidatus Berkelbacteria bacterium Licking1014_96]|uniref:Orotate phosphoribosyltransferase n=1 Tax=Candidatus Berkelbacteria bacterium Licking1014_96 TaxID=2017149 RepID=A0A554LGR0_9BACT|nr:MAG: hypothetical protein CEN92_194 [Candidatus Berkelbacteria bacterium Licking1014_96]